MQPKRQYSPLHSAEKELIENKTAIIFLPTIFLPQNRLFADAVCDPADQTLALESCDAIVGW